MSKMPVFLINGFLGSGKTTLMLKLIKKLRENDLKVAVVLNELGQANLERHLFSEGNFFELLNGCICCSIQEDLKMVMAELTNLFKRKEADIAIIEGTGVANPSEIHEIFAQSPFSQNFQLQSSVCLADASMLQDYLSIYSSSKEVRNLQKQQIVHASHIVLNKIDLLEKNEQLEKVQKLVRKLNSAEMISKSTYGDCTDEIIQKSSYTIDLQRKTQLEPIQHREIKAVKLKLANLKIARTDINQILIK
ncbi:GTP-binding protein [Robertmurraya massiliosenegalensis]|uniref:GTP-binding protein n=1 Tax=Robertmurraya massiliosenegalensis TaxID=1287657 RepID=UPI0003053568|nr:GTP-binding protein [Robertmurraya massiliosenegalensis]